jgi:hypothetical protein
MAETSPTPSYRLKLPCAGEAEFREKFQNKYVEKGIFVPSERPKPVGTRVKLKLEIRTGAVLLSGDGMVTAVVKPGAQAKPGMTVRLTALHPESIRFPLSPGRGGALESAGAQPPPLRAVPPGATPPPLPPALVHDELFGPDEDLSVEAVPGAEPEKGVSAMTDHAIPVLDIGSMAPEPPRPTPPPSAGPPRTAHRLPSRRVILAAAGGLVLVAAVAIGASLSARGARADRERSAKVEEHLRLADLRLLEGRLASARGDSALDHLLEAKTLAQNDERVTTRLKLLADKFEQLGDRALARKNQREAAVHYRATLMSDPTRAKARERLDAIEAPPR